eukprot:GHVU01144196.1.p1 GENE.GHVU01144196.1~~GHVU01144196.1.p1  ORF type:complete len:169 (-),score=25.54 GHVU01144196.1:114-620(-)
MLPTTLASKEQRKGATTWPGLPPAGSPAPCRGRKFRPRCEEDIAQYTAYRERQATRKAEMEAVRRAGKPRVFPPPSPLPPSPPPVPVPTAAELAAAAAAAAAAASGRSRQWLHSDGVANSQTYRPAGVPCRRCNKKGTSNGATLAGCSVWVTKALNSSDNKAATNSTL